MSEQRPNFPTPPEPTGATPALGGERGSDPFPEFQRAGLETPTANAMHSGSLIPPDPEEPPASPLLPDDSEPETVPGGDLVPRAVRERTVHTAALARSLIALLNWSFRIGAILLLAGLILMFVQGDALAATLPAPGAVVDLALAGRASAIVYLSLLAFMVAPVVAVAVTIGGFLRLHDRRYAIISALVLLVLGASIALALGRG